MADQYFFTHDGSQFGPFSADDMRAQAAAGHILRTDVVWREGTERRVVAAKVQNLFAARPAGPPQEAGAPVAPPSACAAPSAEACPSQPPPPEPAPAASGLAEPSGPAVPDGTSGEAAAGEPAGKEGSSVLVGEPEVAAPDPAPVPDRDRHAPPQSTAPKRRVVSIKGAVLVSQNGREFKYRKKCSVCGHENSSWSTATIPKGASRSTFYCPNCRKVRAVEILGAG